MFKKMILLVIQIDKKIAFGLIQWKLESGCY